MRYANKERTFLEIIDGDKITVIPADPLNADYAAILESGATIEDYQEPEIPDVDGLVSELIEDEEFSSWFETLPKLEQFKLYAAFEGKTLFKETFDSSVKKYPPGQALSDKIAPKFGKYKV